ncbi:PDZ domain-containing protein 8-like isoform X1 [Penaeus chinensis]|uniref:PDZ domain-containing protein 8-like isoform X1 n=1 Tax=Penaeus chinensis TaxID=139456 RepID=UPI001FB5840A|nr:PDZ domain-containing protein 8-like isoform X1 [Penaeus chinensis]
MLGAFLWNLFIFASGAISILISAWWWITTQEELPPEPKRRPVVNSSLPEDLAEKLRADSYHKRETCFALNLILQFFFQEKRYESGILRWVTNQLTLEFNELLKHKALSKVIHNMQIRDLNLGTNFPVIKAVTAKHVNLNPDTSVLEQIDILVEVEYNGGIQLAVDASSRLSKAAMVKIKVVHLSGNGRLQFSRHPFTHWSFSFFEEPQVEFEVYSSLGLHIPRFNSIITSQLKGILKRKHTLPYFKLRGPPLIKRPLQPTNEEGCSVPPGRLTGAVVKCSRLQTALIGEVMYCTVILCEVPIVCAVEKPSGVWAILDLTLKRPHGSSAGILLHNADEGVQMVESVTQCSPAHAAGLKKNDILLAVNGTYLHSGHQAAKLFTTNNINGDSNSILLRVKRLILPESKKMVAEQRAVGSDGATTVVGEDTTGRPQVTSCGQPVVSPCTASSSYSGDKSSSAWVESSSSGTSGCGGSGDGTARGGAGLSRSCGVGSISRGGGVGRAGGGGNETSSASSGTSGGYYVNVGSCSRGVGGSYRGADYPSASSCVGSGGVGMYVGSSSGGTEDEGVLGGSRAVSPSHLLAGLMGSLNGSRPAKHRSLPGSPVLQRTSRNRVNSTRDGEISGSGRSTPDSSHNSSPELKRKLLDLHTLTVDSKPTVPGQDKSPVAASVNKTVPRPVIGVGPDKSPGPGVGGQSFGLSQSGVEKPPSNQSSKAGTPTSPDSLMGLSNLEKRGGRRYMGKSKTHLKSIQTPFVDGNREPMFESDFEFWLEEENKYLSIAIWSRNITSVKPDEDFGFKDNKDKAKTKENEKDRRKQKESEKAKAREEVLAGLTEDTLVGYSNLPLISLIPETTLNTQGHVTKILTLNPPHPKCPEMISDSLLAHKGFDMKLCYGDVMLSLTYQPQDRCETLGRGILDKNYASSPISEDESLTDGTLSEEDEISVTQEIVEDRNHDFKRTHFHSATHCDFCRKKIWLKDAYQCGECGIICHKKCMVRCEQETVCASSGLRYRDPSRNEPHDARDVKEMPEIVTTAAVGSADNGSPGNTPPVSPHTQRRTLGSLFAQVASAGKGSLKRAGSAHNLAPPNPSHDGILSRSLPPSPPHSPQQSRKASLSEGANPFVIDTDEGDTVGSVLDRLLLFPHDERLVTLARESAKDLHSVLPGAERRERINLTLLQLQDAVDREGEVRVDLARQEREAGDAGDALTRASVALQISQCDARTQALALLTLHYCTALQYCTDDVQEGEGEDQIQDVNDEEKKAKGKEKQAEG